MAKPVVDLLSRMIHYVFQGFVAPSGGRNTLSLVFDCLRLVITASWSSTHPNFRASGDTDWVVYMRRAQWMAWGIIAPEYVAFLAIRQWFEVRWLRREIYEIMKQRRSKHTGVQVTAQKHTVTDAQAFEWLPVDDVAHEDAKSVLDAVSIDLERLDKLDRTQSIPSSTRLTVAEYTDTNSQQGTSGYGKTPASSTDSDNQTSSEPITQETMAYTYYIYMGGVLLSVSENNNFRLTPLQFLDMLEAGLIDLPKICTEDMDIFAKLWVLMYMFWYLAMLIMRMASHQLVTLIELFTAAQVFCSIACSLAWWAKPRAIHKPTKVAFKGDPKDVKDIKAKYNLHEDRNGFRVGENDNIKRNRTGMKSFLLIGFVPIFAFAACHLLAWDAYFITPVEAALWRISSVCCLVLPSAIIALGNITGGGHARVLRPGISILVCLYIIFRLFVCVEILASLRQVPSGVYEVNSWSVYFPQVGS